MSKDTCQGASLEKPAKVDEVSPFHKALLQPLRLCCGVRPCTHTMHTQRMINKSNVATQLVVDYVWEDTENVG